MRKFNLRKMFYFVVLLCLTVTTLQGGWNAAQAAKLEKSVIKVGYVGGMNFIFGKQMLQAAQDAAEEINKAGGVLGSKIEIVSADSGLTAAGANSAIAKLVTSDNVDYLIGGYTSEEATAFQSAAEKFKKVSFIHITTNRFDESYLRNPEAHKYIFAVSASESVTVDAQSDFLPYIVKHLKNELNLKKINVALISDNALWTVNIDKMIQDTFAKYKNDVNLVYHSKPARNATDFTTEISEMLKRDVQLVFVFGGYGSVIPLTKQFQETKVPALLTGSIVLAMTPDNYTKAVGPGNAAYVLSAGVGTEVASARDAKMVKAFKTKHVEYPGHYAVEGYNMIKALANGLEKAGTMNADKLSSAIERSVIPAEQAWGGAVVFKNHRTAFDYDLNKGMRIYIMQYTAEGDKTVLVFPEKGATAKIQIPAHMYKKWKK
ncbi:MAG: ABC transporter substrate-binding protein [Deltaproteobacteria bacterium]